MGQFLTAGGASDPFLPRLLEAVRQADRIDLAVAFIKRSGLALIYPALIDAVETRGAHLRVLTSDYLDVTDPQALRRLMLLAERGAEIRVFQTEHQSFHLKASICMQSSEGVTVWGAAFVGSSNLSQSHGADRRPGMAPAGRTNRRCRRTRQPAFSGDPRAGRDPVRLSERPPAGSRLNRALRATPTARLYHRHPQGCSADRWHRCRRMVQELWSTPTRQAPSRAMCRVSDLARRQRSARTRRTKSVEIAGMFAA